MKIIGVMKISTVIFTKLEELENKGLGKLFIKYFLCGLCFYLLTGLLGGLETFIDGYFGSIRLNGILSANRFISLFLSAGSIIGIGGSVLLTIKLGLKDKEKAEEILGNSISLLIIFSFILLLIAYIYKDYFFTELICSGDKEITIMATNYFIARLSGITFIFMAEYLILFILALGNPIKALLLKLISFLLKISVLFIYIKFDLGIIYRALLFNLSDLIIVFLILNHFTKKESNVPKLRWNKLKLRKISLDILLIGIFPYLFFLSQTFYNIFINCFTNSSIEQLVSISLINTNLYIPVLSLLSVFCWLRPIFTYNYTKNNFIRTKKLLFNCALILPLLVLILLIPLIFFKNILNLFVHDLNMIDTARRILNSYIFIIPLLLFKGIIFVYLQSIAKKLKLAVIYISNMLLLIVPLYIMWRFHIEIEFNGWLFLNIVIASLMFIISLIFFITELKSLKNKITLICPLK